MFTWSHLTNNEQQKRKWQMTEDKVEKPKGDFLLKGTELLPLVGIKALNKYHNAT